jgi:hypothetical protein
VKQEIERPGDLNLSSGLLEKNFDNPNIISFEEKVLKVSLTLKLQIE